MMRFVLVLTCALCLGTVRGGQDTDICFVVSGDPVPPTNATRQCARQGGRFFNSSYWLESDLLGNRSIQAASFATRNNISTWIAMSNRDGCNNDPTYQNVKCEALGLHRFVCFFSNRSAAADGRCEQQETSTQDGAQVSSNSSTSTPSFRTTTDVALFAGVTVAAAMGLILIVVALLVFCRWRRRRRPKVRGSRRSRSGANNHKVIVHQMSLPYPDPSSPGHVHGVEGQSLTPLGQGEYWFFEQPELPGGGARRGSRSTRHCSGAGSEKRGSGLHTGYGTGEGAWPDQIGVTQGLASHMSGDVKLGQYVEVSGSQTGHGDTSPPSQNVGKFDTWSGLGERRVDVAHGRGLQTTGRGLQITGRGPDKPSPFRLNAGYAEPVDSVFSEERGAPAPIQWGKSESASGEIDYVRLASLEGEGSRAAAANSGTEARDIEVYCHTIHGAASRDNDPNYDVLLLRQQKSHSFVNPYEHILASNLN